MSQIPEFRHFSNRNRRSAIQLRIWSGTGVLLALALTCIGLWRIRHLHDATLAYWEGQLGSVADVTRYAVRQWVSDRDEEMRALADLIAAHPEYLESDSGRDSAARREKVQRQLNPYLQLIKQQNLYMNIWVTADDGRVIASGEEGSIPQQPMKDIAIRSVREGRSQIVGPRFDARGVLTLIFTYPIFTSHRGTPASGNSCRGAVLLTVDPSYFLFPLISVESMPVRNGEYLLAARVGDEFQILSPLRHPPAPALSVRMPWEKAPPLYRISVEKEEAFGEFTDFRGRSVVAVTRHISGTVGLIRQVDRSEAFAAYHTQVRTELLLAAAILGMFGLTFLVFQRTVRASHLREVAASQSRLAGIINAAMDAIIALDAELRITLFNPAAEQMFRCGAEEVLGTSGLELMPERSREDSRKRFMQFGHSGQPSARTGGLNLGRRRNGEEFPLEASISRLSVDGEEIFLVIARDITERKRAEELLRSTEEKYRQLFEESKEVVFISSAEGKILDINPAGLELFGYDSKEELSQVDIAKSLYVNPQDREEARRVCETQGFVKDYEIAIKRKDGQKRIVLETSGAVRDEMGVIAAYRGILRDITEQKSLERQLLQSQKMDAVGQLAGGIAHDFNNILTAILGYTELLLSDFDTDNRHRRDVQEIGRAAERAASLTRQLLAFSRRQVMQPKVLGLNSFIVEMDKMLKRLITENISLRTILDPALGSVKADPAQIEQVILNLVVNARDAMQGGGVLTIESRNVSLTEVLPAQPMNVPPGNYAMVAVSDTGHGIDPEVQSRIFEPFFTTKEIGKGTGLGLSMVYGIVKQSGGFITVDSESGTGTTFRIYLLRTADAETAADKSDAPSGSLEGRETILLAEDEPAVRSLLRDILERYKYRVIGASNGEEALDLAKNTRDPIHLVVTDVVMPEMGGAELVRRLTSLHPETRVLYMSGHADAEISKPGALKPGRNFLPKPFVPLDLARIVRKLLDER